MRRALPLALLAAAACVTPRRARPPLDLKVCVAARTLMESFGPAARARFSGFGHASEEGCAVVVHRREGGPARLGGQELIAEALAPCGTKSLGRFTARFKELPDWADALADALHDHLSARRAELDAARAECAGQ